MPEVEGFPSAVRVPGKRVDGIDGLRTVAVMTVIFYHFHEDALPGGSIGVDVFYTISGFVITRLLVAEFARTGDIGLWQFYRRRWLRLVPALLVVCALTALLSLAPVPTFKHGVSAALLAAFSLVNLVRAAQSGGYTGVTAPLGHTWSLGVEEQFYLVWPPVLLALLRRLKARTVLSAAVVLTLLPVLWRYHLWNSTAAHRIYNGPDTRADQLLAGAVLAIVLARLAPDDPWRETMRTWAARLWLPALTLLALMVWQVQITGRSAWNGPEYTVGFLVTALLAVVVLTSLELLPRSPLTRLLSLAPLAWIGRNLSYGLYLWHYPLMHLLGDLGVKRMLFPSTLLATFIMALASYFLVEEPCRRLKQRGRGKPEGPGGRGSHAPATVLPTAVGAPGRAR
ncbi:Peptidoglycan/LPS O-acetylase OafA/YrhL, contains acyltransferase and SGNH-hydrolase domains [Actinacidiphila yanglinensis]|uniref:Peptidoglycan/LPS O-acetylase OafA/YrhL, contains acyltransferase and SGNH-hydrolase domains n=1 Tax=Actinacidiphila yanglinensis TaxID=310779 RepID=A0A1H6B134_9ACTN|nr:acyltransferase [Actinacidiphila yanglinensis]SEG54519.1 Peptidoglycan/LPS O-acetylase OafA/YrhL, contains acyltransferase and SGNH-hydrolase domains [Actinacidiphila yanglinensis]